VTTLHAGRYGVRIPRGARYVSVIQNVENGAGTQSVSNGYWTSLPQFRMSGDIPLLPVYAFMAWTGTALPLPIYIVIIVIIVFKPFSPLPLIVIKI
jgi:hypothetical protein